MKFNKKSSFLVELLHVDGRTWRG